ncbi:ABC-three component system middle component 6 [Mycobacterium simiae]|uniref:ABC-three component system middle component 6 n=1 Tax=Mycobacterium simiae TaxID=1784 RepID=UPI00358E85EA
MTDLLPSKYVPLSMSFIGQAAAILDCRRETQTVSDLWARARSEGEDLSFASFVDSLTVLHALGAVDFRRGILRWRS